VPKNNKCGVPIAVRVVRELVLKEKLKTTAILREKFVSSLS
jgi:hypothetical protein